MSETVAPGLASGARPLQGFRRASVAGFSLPAYRSALLHLQWVVVVVLSYAIANIPFSTSDFCLPIPPLPAVFSYQPLSFPVSFLPLAAPQLPSRVRTTCTFRLSYGPSQFVISLWGLDLAAVIKAVSTPLHRRKRPLPAPRALLLKPGGSHRSARRPGGRASGKGDGGSGGGGGGGGGGSGRGEISSNHSDDRAGRSSGADGGIGQVGGRRCAIRGIDCIRPSFLSGRKRSSLGIIDEHCYRQGPFTRSEDGEIEGGDGDGAAESAADSEPEGAGGIEAGADVESDGLEACGREWSVGGGAGRKNRGKRSGAACRKRRRQCKEARRLKAATAAAAATAVAVAAAAVAAAAAEAAAVVLATRSVAAVGAL